MTLTDEIEAGMVLAERLVQLIPVWIDRARKAGELTEEQEKAYGERQAAVYARPSAQPEAPPAGENPTPATPPFIQPS